MLFRVGDKVRIIKDVNRAVLSDLAVSDVYPDKVYKVAKVFVHPENPSIDVLLLDGIVIKTWHKCYAQKFFELVTTVGFVISAMLKSFLNWLQRLGLSSNENRR